MLHCSNPQREIPLFTTKCDRSTHHEKRTKSVREEEIEDHSYEIEQECIPVGMCTIHFCGFGGDRVYPPPYPTPRYPTSGYPTPGIPFTSPLDNLSPGYPTPWIPYTPSQIPYPPPPGEICHLMSLSMEEMRSFRKRKQTHCNVAIRAFRKLPDVIMLQQSLTYERDFETVTVQN